MVAGANLVQVVPRLEDDRGQEHKEEYGGGERFLFL